MVETLTDKDNSFLDIDILGSWMEVGMVVIAVFAGCLVMYPIILGIIKKNKGVVGPDSENYRSHHLKMHEILTETRVRLNADRALIMQFHNGGEYMDGTSMKRVSVTHESCCMGVSETFDKRRELLLSNFIEMLNFVPVDKAIVEATSNLSDCHFKRQLESNHTLVFCIYPIKGMKSLTTSGFMLIEWCNWDKADLIDDDVVKIELPQSTRYIEGELLNNKE